jgi:hypothetical protein
MASSMSWSPLSSSEVDPSLGYTISQDTQVDFCHHQILQWLFTLVLKGFQHLYPACNMQLSNQSLAILASPDQ